WAEKAGPEPVVPQIAGEAGTAPSAPPDPPPRRGRSRQKGRFVKGDIERSPERVFLPGQKNPVVLRQNTSELHLIARLPDDGPRFAITFHRKLRRDRNH